MAALIITLHLLHNTLCWHTWKLYTAWPNNPTICCLLRLSLLAFLLFFRLSEHNNTSSSLYNAAQSSVAVSLLKWPQSLFTAFPKLISFIHLAAYGNVKTHLYRVCVIWRINYSKHNCSLKQMWELAVPALISAPSRVVLFIYLCIFLFIHLVISISPRHLASSSHQSSMLLKCFPADIKNLPSGDALSMPFIWCSLCGLSGFWGANPINQFVRCMIKVRSSGEKGLFKEVS